MTHAQSVRLLGALLTALGIWVATTGAAFAADVTYCAAFPPSPTDDCRQGPISATNWSGNLTLPQFDPALGTLNAVQLTVEGFVQGDVQYENTGPTAAIISATHSVTISVVLPNGDLVRSIPSTTRVELVPPFDGVLDFGGISGRTFSISNTKNISLTLIAPLDLAPFVGTGLVTVPAEALGISFIRGPGNLSALLRAQAASVVVAVTYFYASPGIDIEKFTNGRDADDPNSPDVPQIAPGEPVLWTYLVRNTGSIPFAQADIVVTDDHPGVVPQLVPSSDAGSDGILSPGETWIYTATLPAQNLDNASTGTTIVPGCDPTGTSISRPTYRNVGSVVVNELSDADPSHYCNPPGPGITIQKLTNGADADGPNDPDVPQIAPGDTVTWTYLVTNTGVISYPQASVLVSDSHPSVTPVLVDDGDGDGFLAPGEVWRYQATLPAQNLLTPSLDTVIVPGCNPDATGLPRATYRNIGVVLVDSLTDFDPSHYCNPPEPGIDIEKLVNNNDADNPNDADVPQLTPGDTVNWLYRVTNTGNVPFALDDVVVTDSQPGIVPLLDPLSDEGGDKVLSPGEIWIYRASDIVQTLVAPAPGTVVVSGCNPDNLPVPGDRATYRNVGAVTAPGAQDQDPAHYCNPPSPGIVIKKLTNGADADDPNGADVPVIRAGEAVTWTYLITNTGNIAFDLAQISVTDDQAGVTPMFNPESDNGDEVLSPGEVWRYVATGIALDLQTAQNVTIVSGCANDEGVERNTYANIGAVRAGNLTDTDPSHYCNPPPNALGETDEPNHPNAGLLYLPLVQGNRR